MQGIPFNLMRVWGLSQPFKAFAKGTVPAGGIIISLAKARAAKTCFNAKTPSTKAGQL